MARHTRREFLENAIVSTVRTGLTLTALPPDSLLVEPQAATDPRSHTAGRFALELGKTKAGLIQSAEGGSEGPEKPSADVLRNRSSTPGKFADITLGCGTGMSPGFYDWIAASISQKPLQQSGAVVVYDNLLKEMERLEWQNALIKKIGFPALDAASKDAAKMTVTISPEITRRVPGSGAKLAAQDLHSNTWLQSNFRLQVTGLDCSRVNKIEALVFKQGSFGGIMRTNRQEVGQPEISSLVITFPESSGDMFYQWRQDSVIKGKQPATKDGQLEYLSSNQGALFTISFHRLAISTLAPAEAGAENIKRMKAEMYCEEMKFSYSSGATWA